jgi:recombination protein RecT
MSAEIATKPSYVPKPEEFRKPVANVTQLKAMGQSVMSGVADALPSFMRKQAPAMLRALYTECQKTPGLLSCTPESLFGCTIQAAQMGLMLGGALGQCYLIPFKGRATLVPGYKGYIQLVNRSGQVGVISAYTVYDADHFEIELGTHPRIIHKPGQYPDLKAIQGRKSVAFYATCMTKQGPTFQALTRAEAEHHRDRFALSKGKGPWIDHFDEMAKKTCIIKLCKYLPMSAELQTAINIDELAETDTPFDCSFLFAENQPEQSRTEQLRERLDSTRTEAQTTQAPQPDMLTRLIQEAEAAGILSDFLSNAGLLIEDLESSKGKKRAEHCDALALEIQAATKGGAA